MAEFLDGAGCSGEVWGWKIDAAAQHRNAWVLYVELPCGQVSWHSAERFAGPDYAGDWDGSGQSEERVLRFCEDVLASP